MRRVRVSSTALCASRSYGVSGVADEQVRERHAQRPVLQLPHVTELVHEQVVVVAARFPPQEDRPVRRIAVEPPEPREAEEPRRDEHAHALRANRPRVEAEVVQPRLRGAKPLVHGTFSPR